MRDGEGNIFEVVLAGTFNAEGGRRRKVESGELSARGGEVRRGILGSGGEGGRLVSQEMTTGEGLEQER